MPDDIIPNDVKHYILGNIDSIAQLEGLLMLRANPQKGWSVEEIAHGLYIDESQVTLLLSCLLEQGFLITTGNGSSLRYQYQPKSSELRDIMNRLADLYTQYLVPITNLVHSKSRNRIQEFSNAFKIRKD